MPSNKSIIFKAVPEGYPVAGEHMELVTKEIDIENFSLAEGDILVKNHYMSLDPYMRGKMRHSYVKSYTPAYEIGQVLDGRGIAIVVKSNNKKYQVGDYYIGLI
ncbi:1860_t:CDS:1, partial [Gigaspora rosea]